MPPAPEVALPPRMRHLPMDPTRPYRVPWFVAWIDDKPDFRVIRTDGIMQAHRGKICWLCGGPMSAYKAFVIGPMCAVNRISAEPPSHRDCAIYSARVCPFLTRPNMVRRPGAKPEGTGNPAGIMIERNPGITLVWVTRSYKLIGDGNGGVLFNFADPTEALWFREGREATREEVLAGIETGVPTLREYCVDDREHALLDTQVAAAMTLVPA